MPTSLLSTCIIPLGDSRMGLGVRLKAISCVLLGFSICKERDAQIGRGI